MSGELPDRAGEPTPLARATPTTVSGAVPRRRVVLSGTVTATRRREWPCPVFEADLEDGTGTATLVYLGRRGVPGVEVGARVVAEATIASRGGRLELLNPVYRFEPAGGG